MPLLRPPLAAFRPPPALAARRRLDVYRELAKSRLTALNVLAAMAGVEGGRGVGGEGGKGGEEEAGHGSGDDVVAGMCAGGGSTRSAPCSPLLIP